LQIKSALAAKSFQKVTLGESEYVPDESSGSLYKTRLLFLVFIKN